MEGEHAESEENQVTVDTPVDRHNHTEHQEVDTDLEQRVQDQPDPTQKGVGVLGPQVGEGHSDDVVAAGPQFTEVFAEGRRPTDREQAVGGLV